MQSYRYTLQRGGKKLTCPDCGKKTFVPFVDTQNNEKLPAEYGRCDREVNCGYFKHPHQELTNNNPRVNNEIFSPVDIPIEVMKRSRRDYDKNTFVSYLVNVFGREKATELITLYHIGTSNSRWKGAAVFWFINSAGSIRAGQVKLFDNYGHTAKHQQPDGSMKSCTTWIHSLLQRQYKQAMLPLPAWLNEYTRQHNSYITCLFGEHLVNQDTTKPIAIVEAPATAIVASAFIPEFIWLAAGSLSYLNIERTKALHGRNVVLFPDLSTDGKAFSRWKQIATQLSDFMVIQVSDLLERNATSEERKKGLDLRDFLTRETAVLDKVSAENVLKGTLKNLRFEIKSLIAISCPGDYTGGLQQVTFELEEGGHCEMIIQANGEFYSGKFSESLKRVWGEGFQLGRIGGSDTYMRFKS